MPDIRDPAHGPGSFISPDGPKGPGGIAPNGEGPNKSAEAGHGFLKGRRVTLPPQGEAALKAAGKAHPVAASKVGAKNDEPAPAKLSERTVTPKNGQLNDAEKPSARFLREKAGEMAAGAGKPNDLPKREMQQPSAPPREGGPDAPPVDISLNGEQPGLPKAHPFADASAPDFGDLPPGEPAGNNGEAAPNGSSSDDLLGALALLSGNQGILDQATLEGASLPPIISERGEDQNFREVEGEPAVPQGPDSGVNISNAILAASEATVGVLDDQEFSTDIYNSADTILHADLNDIQAPARHIDHETQLSRAALRYQVHVFPEKRKLHVFQPLDHAQHQALRQQYPDYQVVEVPEEFHDHVFTAVQSHIDTKKQEYEKKLQENKPHQHSANSRNVGLDEAAASEKAKLIEKLKAAQQEIATRFEGVNSLFKQILQGFRHHAKEAKANYEKLRERVVEANALLNRILKGEIGIMELKRAETIIATLQNDLKQEEARLQSLLKASLTQ